MSRRYIDDSGDNRRINRREWLAALGIGGMAGLAGCSDEEPGDGADDSGSDDEEETGIDQDEEVTEFPDVAGSYDTMTSAGFETLNPLYNTESGAGTAIAQTIDQGYTFDSNGDPFPLVFSEMSSDDNQVWTFTVREGLQFSDPYGEVTAESFVYQIQELHQSDWANTASTEDWSDATVEQTGEYEFQVELPSPQPLYLQSFDPLEYPIPRDLVEPYVDEEDVDGLQTDEELLELQFTGNLGPYTLDAWDRGSGTRYSRNDEYYIQEIEEGPDLFQEAPYFEERAINVVEEQSSRLGALETGEADSAAIPPERLAEFDDLDNVSVLNIPQPFNEILSVNMRDNGWNAGPGNLFRITEFRQAMASAINKEELIAGVYRGLAEPHYTWQPRFSDFYPGDDELTLWGTGDQYGSEVARSLAEEAFDESEFDYQFDGDALVTPDGDQVVLDIYHSAGQEVEQSVAEFVAQELDDNLGIEVEVEAIDGTRFGQDFWTADPQGGTDTVRGEELEWESPNPNNPGPRSVTSDEAWDMSLVFGLNTFPLNPLTNQLFFDGANGFYNPVGYYPDTDLGPFFADARDATTIDGIQDALIPVFEAINEEQPYIMLLFDPDLVGYNADLRGPIENFNNGWDFPTWHFDE